MWKTQVSRMRSCGSDSSSKSLLRSSRGLKYVHFLDTPARRRFGSYFYVIYAIELMLKLTVALATRL